MRLALSLVVVSCAVFSCRSLDLPDGPSKGGLHGVLDLQGRLSPAGVTVTLISPGGQRDQGMTDASGAFAFADLAPGVYSVALSRLPGFADLQVVGVVTSGNQLDLGTLQPSLLSDVASPGTLIGKVVVAGGGDPRGGEVELLTDTQPAVTVAVLQLGSSGAFVQQLLPGDYTVRVTHPLYVTATVTATIQEGETNDLSTQPITLLLNPGRINGTVRAELESYADGGVVSGTVPAEGALVTSDTGLTATVDVAGRFELMGLPGGTRTLTVTLANHHDTATHVVTLGAGQTVTLPDFSLALDRSTVIGQVRMGDGTPLVGATASIPGTPYSAPVAPDVNDASLGRFVLPRIPPGAYVVRAERTSYLAVSSPVVNVQGEGRTFDVGTLPSLTRVQGDFEIDDLDATNTPGFSRVRGVKLRVTNTGAVSEYRVAEGNATLTGVTFQPYTTNVIDFTLTSGDGAKTLSLQFKDAQGNLSAILSATVVLDTTPPSSPSVVIAGGKTFTNLSNNFPVTLTATDSGSGLAFVRLAGTNAVDGAGELVAPRVAWFRDSTFTRTGSAEGRQDVFVQFTDHAGNFNAAPATSFIIVDTLPPTGTLAILDGPAATQSGLTNSVIAELTSTVATEPNGGGVSVRLVNELASDLPNAALQQVRARTTWLLEPTDGLKTVHYQLVDAAGNAAAPGQLTLRLDTVKPTATAALAGSSPTNNATVTLSLTANDGAQALSPTRALTLSEDPSYAGLTGGPFPSGGTAMTTLASDGPHLLFVLVRDAAGNTTELTVPVTLDRVAPTGGLEVRGTLADGTTSDSFTTTTSVTVSISHAGATGYQLGNESLSCASGTYLTLPSAPVAHTLSGSLTPRQVRLCLRDDAGNTWGPISAPITLDGTAPTGCQLAVTGTRPDGTAAPAGKTARPNLTVTVSGCAETPTEMFLTTNTVTCANATPLAWVPYAASSTLTFSAPDGLQTVRGCVRDATRNVGSVVSTTITLDTTPPVAPSALVVDNGATYVNKATYDARSMRTIASIAASAPGATEWTLSETNPPPSSGYQTFTSPFDFTFGGTGARTVYARFRDDVGNETGVVSGTITFDITPPSTTALALITPTGNAFTNSVSIVVRINGQATDATQLKLVEATGASCTQAELDAVSSRVKTDLNTFLLSSGDMQKRVCGQFIDAAGNPSAIVSATVTLDTVAPTTPQVLGNDSFLALADDANHDVVISADSTDTNFARYEVLGGKTTGWTPATPVATRTFRFKVVNDGAESGYRNELRVRALDLAGNISGDTGLFVTADTNAPEAVTADPTWIDNGSGRGMVVWQPSSSTDVTSHLVYYDSAGADPLAGAFAVEGPSPVTTGTQTNVTLSGLPNGSSTYVRVRPVDRAGNRGPFAPDTGGPPLQLQPNEVSVNQFASLLLGTRRVSKLLVHGDLLFVGATGHTIGSGGTCSTPTTADSSLLVVDLSSLASPITNGAVVTPTPQGPVVLNTQTFTDAVTCQQGELAVDLAISPPYLFMTSGTKVRIFNISNPLAPTQVTFLDFGLGLTSINLVGDRGFVTSGTAGLNHILHTMNFSSLWDNASGTMPTFPASRVGTVDTGFTSFRTSTVSRDRVIAIQGGVSGTQIDVFNASNALLAVPANSAYGFSTQNGFSMPMKALASGSYLYAMSSVGGLSFYDLTNAWTNSNTVGPPFLATGYTGGGQFDVVGDQVFAGDLAGSRFRSISTADLSNVTETGTYSLGNGFQPSASTTFGNYAVVATAATTSLQGQLRFLELATARALRARAAVAVGNVTRVEVSPGFVTTGGGMTFDLHQGESPVRGSATWLAICSSGSTRFGEIEAWSAGNVITLMNLEKNLDRNGGTNTVFGTDSLTITLAAGIRVGGLAAWGNNLIAVEHRSDGVYLEAFDVRPMLHRQQGTFPALPSRGAFRVTTSFLSTQSQYLADLQMHRGRAIVTVNNSIANPGAGGANTFIVDLRALVDDDSTTSVPATAVQGTLTGYASRTAVVKGNQLYVAHTNGVSVFDVSLALDENLATTSTSTPVDLLTGVPIDGLSVTGSTLLASAEDGRGGLYSMDLSTTPPSVQAVVPLSSGSTPCTAGNGESNRAMRSQVTVRGTRAWVITNKTMRSYELE